jgi:RNA polymerase sigma-70 factor (ECF subfamily)
MRREVIELARHGDREAFEALASESVDRLYAIACLVLHDRSLAEDAVQDALIRVWRDLPQLRAAESFEAWTRRILVHACLDLARRERGRRAVHELPELLFGAERVEDDVADREAIGRGLQRLSLRDRTVLVLRFYLGLSVPEIANAMRVPAGTVKSRLHNAQEAMRAAIEADSRFTLQGGLA